MKNLTFYLLFAALGCGLTILFMKGCDRAPATAPLVDTKPIQKKVNKELKQKDSLKVRAVKSESVAVIYRDRWRKADTIILTKTRIVNLCDSVLETDSTALTDCKKVNSVNDSIISHLQLWIKADSVNYSALQDTVKVRDAKIKKLKRKVFWANFRTALVGVGWIAREGYVLVNR